MATMRIIVVPTTKALGCVTVTGDVDFDRYDENNYYNAYYEDRTPPTSNLTVDGNAFIAISDFEDTNEMSKCVLNFYAKDGYCFDREYTFITSSTQTTRGRADSGYYNDYIQLELDDAYYSENDTILTLHGFDDTFFASNSSDTYKYVYCVMAVKELPKPQYTFTHDLQHASATPDEGEYEEGTSLTVNISSDTGYYFTDDDTLNIAPAILDENGEVLEHFTQPTGSRTINGVTWYTGNFRGISMSNNRAVRAYAMNPYDLEYVDVTEDLTGCRCSHSEQYLKDTTVTLTAEVSNTAYVFNDAPEIQFENGDILQFTVAEDLKSASITFIAKDNFTIYAHAETPKVYHNVTGNFTNCYLESADTFAEGEDYTILIRANDGYIFNDNIEINYNYLYVNLDSSCFYDNDTLVRYTLPASYNVTTDIRIISAVAIRDVETVSNFAHLYKVTTRVLNELAKVRFYNVSGESSEVVDYGQYITNLMRIPFALPDDYIGDNANIQLGMYDSGVSAPTLLYDDLYIDIGTIHVTPKYDNVYDYRETSAILHLPFSEDIEIPLEYCMDKDVHITYKMDLYTGDTTIIITSAFTGDIVATSTVTIGTQIPFIQMQNDSIVNRLEKFIDNGIRTAFIEVKRNIPYNVYCEFGKPTVDYGIIGDYKGYIEVSDCTINVPCTTSEQELIKTTLQSGIIIK